MVFPGDNPPPSDPFAPTPMTPGQFGGPVSPGPIGPSSFQPPPSSGSSAWKYILIGCLAIVLLGGIVTVGSCVYLASKGGSAMSGVLKIAKQEYLTKLSPDHTPEQRARFEQAYDFYADESKTLGVVAWGTKYSDATEKLSALEADGQISVEESQAWADMILSGGAAPEGDTGGADENSGTTTTENSGGEQPSGEQPSGGSGTEEGGDFSHK